MKDKLQNIWYYHKTIIIIAVLVLAAVLFVSIQNAGSTTPDEQIAIISPDSYSEESIQALERAFSEYTGHTVLVKHYRVELGADDQDGAVIGSLDADLVSKQSTSFLLKNVTSFQEATNNLQITEPILVGSIDSLKGLGFDDLYYVQRITE